MLPQAQHTEYDQAPTTEEVKASAKEAAVHGSHMPSFVVLGRGVASGFEGSQSHSHCTIFHSFFRGRMGFQMLVCEMIMTTDQVSVECLWNVVVERFSLQQVWIVIALSPHDSNANCIQVFHCMWNTVGWAYPRPEQRRSELRAFGVSDLLWENEISGGRGQDDSPACSKASSLNIFEGENFCRTLP